MEHVRTVGDISEYRLTENGLRVLLLPGEGLPVHAVRFQAAGSIGPALGGDGGFMWHVRAGVNVDITPRLSAMFGYRLLELDVDNDAYTFEAGLQGLFFAGSYRF